MWEKLGICPVPLQRLHVDCLATGGAAGAGGGEASKSASSQSASVSVSVVVIGFGSVVVRGLDPRRGWI